MAYDLSLSAIRRLVLSQPLPDRLLERLRTAPLVQESQIDHSARYTGLDAPNRMGALTKVEARLLQAISFGLSDHEAADIVGVPYDTGQDHLRRARRVLAAKNTTHAVALAIRRGDI